MVQDLAAWLAGRAWDSYQVCLATQLLLLVLAMLGLKRSGPLRSLGRFLWELFQVGVVAVVFYVLIVQISPYWVIALVALTTGKALGHRTAGVLVGVIALLVHVTFGWEGALAAVRG